MIVPLWIINCAKSELLLYANLPCQKSKLFKSLKVEIEKSLAKAACIPSFPYIPTPTWADWIKATSLPPSPIPNTRPNLLNCRTKSATSAFWVGDTREQIIAGRRTAIWKNY